MTQAKRKTKKALFYPQSVRVRLSRNKRKKLINLCVVAYQHGQIHKGPLKRLRNSFNNMTGSELRGILKRCNPKAYGRLYG